MPSTPALLLALAGIVFLATGGRIRRANVASASWLPVSGTVLTSGVAPQEGGFTPSVSYRYAIGGETFVSSDIALTLVSTSSEASARDAAARFPVGSPVIAFVNPQNHRQAILEPRRDSLLPAAFLSAGMLLLGLSLCLILAGVLPLP